MRPAYFIGGFLILFAVFFSHGNIAEYLSSDNIISTGFFYYLIWAVRASAFAFGVAFIWYAKSSVKTLQILTLMSSILFSIIVFELICQLFFPNFTKLGHRLVYAWPPNYYTEFNIEKGILPGVSGRKIAQANSKGFRGREIDAADSKRIVIIGGSAAECIYLDQKEAWPELIQQEISTATEPVWVGNLGRSGFDSRHHINQIKYLLEPDDSIDLIIVMVGVNDLFSTLKHGGNYSYTVPGKEPFYKETGIWSLLLLMNNWITVGTPSSIEVENFTKAHNVLKWRIFRENDHTRFNSLPKMDAALDRYRNNIAAIIREARKASDQVLLVNQPTIYDSSGTFENYLCFGGRGDYLEGNSRGYFDQATLRSGMNIINNITRETAESLNVPFLDLSGQMPRDTTVFYDDCHFNEKGSKLAAELIIEKIWNEKSLGFRNGD